jgi:hypothetical protein
VGKNAAKLAKTAANNNLLIRIKEWHCLPESIRLGNGIAQSAGNFVKSVGKIRLALLTDRIHISASLDCIANFQHGGSSGELRSVMI